jgi:hypothetical protein
MPAHLTCGTCHHFKRNPLADVTRLEGPNACLRHPPAPIFQINREGAASAGQAYPAVQRITEACGDHETPEEYAVRKTLHHDVRTAMAKASKVLG